MTRLGLLALSTAALAACGGLSPTTHPLFIARQTDSLAPLDGAPSLSVEMNNLRLVMPASTLTGCSSIAGDYVRKGKSIEVNLRQGTGSATCDAPQRPFITRIGPLPPGAYEVNVMLDGKSLIRAERAVIS